MQLTEDQQMIRDSAEQFLADACTSHTLQTFKPDQAKGDDALWHSIQSELAWPATLIAEANDGLGLGMADMCLILEQAGRRLLNAPLWSTGVWTVAVLSLATDANKAAPLLKALASGEASIACALTPQGMSFQVADLPLLQNTPNGLSLTGRWSLVPEALSASSFVLPVRLNDQTIQLVLVDAEHAHIQPHTVWDLTRPMASVSVESLLLPNDRLIGSAQVVSGLAQAVHYAALGLAAELAGVSARCLELAIDYTKERVQFGRVVASFQAVKHRCAQMMVDLEVTRSAVMGASHHTQPSGETGLVPLSKDQMADIAAAVSLAKDAAFFCAQEAIQLHGGVGFTWEYDPHFYFKRAQSASSLLGSAEQWRESIAEHYLSTGH